MNQIVMKNRTMTVRQRLNKDCIDCLLVCGPANVTYATGFLGDDSWAAITAKNVYLLTDSRYTEQAQTQCRSAKIIERKGPMAETVGNLLKKLKSVKTIAVENSISLAEFNAVKKQVGPRLKISANIIESARSIKGADEIAAITKAGKIAAKAMEQTIPFIKPGISENELAGRLDFHIRQLGSVSSFETIVAFGPNASRPHHKPCSRKLKKSDTILIDWGAKHQGYCSDLTRCFALGPVSKLYQKAYSLVQQAQTAAIKMIKAGAKIADVDAAARNVIAASQLPVYGHGTGHGLGLEVHEAPIMAAKAKGKLQTGMIVTIEPGIYIPGKLGIRIEDDILVTETCGKILTSHYRKAEKCEQTLNH